MQPLTPSYDNKIAHKYSANTLDHKGKNKTALQEENGWVAEPRRAIICLPAETSTDTGADLLMDILPGLMELPVELLVRGKGSQSHGKKFTELEKKFGHRVKIMPDTDDGMRMMLAASDIALFTAVPAEEELLENVLRYGVIPVCPACELLEDYNAIQESGNAFVMDDATSWLAFAAVVRALETHKFPFDWRTIQRHAMSTAPLKQ